MTVIDTNTINFDVAYEACISDNLDSLPWSCWKKLPAPNNCRNIDGPIGAGVYQIRNLQTKENILFGIGKRCSERMTTLYPSPYGKSGRKNSQKKKYVLNNFQTLEFRTLATTTRDVALIIERELKSKKDHIFNT